MHLRQGKKEDKRWLYELYRTTMRSYIEETWGWDENFQAKEFQINLLPEKFKIVIQDGANIGAYLVKQKENCMWIEMLIIQPAMQNKGIGTNIIEMLKSEAKHSQQPIKLSVIKVNPALEFYLRLGFKAYEEDSSFYKLEWTCNNEN